MRTKLLTATILAIAAAVPATAQWAPAPQPYGYGQHGYGNVNHGQFRSLQVRVERALRQIERFDRRNILSNREARRLREQALDVRGDLFRAARDGLNYNELRRFEMRVGQLEFRINREARDLNRYSGQGYGDRYYGNRNYRDRDRDGRPDRWEDDRGRDRD